MSAADDADDLVGYRQDTGWRVVLRYVDGRTVTVGACVEIDEREPPERRCHAWPAVPGYAAPNGYGPTPEGAIFDACSFLPTERREGFVPCTLAEVVPPGGATLAEIASTAREAAREADGLRRQNDRLRRANRVRDDRTSDAFEYGASLMRSRCAELLGELAALAHGEAAAALVNARAHLGALPTADPPQCDEEGWDALRRDIAAGGPDDTLDVRVRRLAEAAGKAEASKEFTASWYSTRWERLRVLLQPTDLWRSACAIMANGTADMGEPPTYAQQFNLALHRAKAAEQRAARAERELAENLPLYNLPPEQRAFFEAQRRVSDLSEAAAKALAAGKRRDAAALYKAATVLELRVLATVPPERARTRASIAKSAEALAHKARASRRARSRIRRTASR